jgi:hypothetical protein
MIVVILILILVVGLVVTLLPERRMVDGGQWSQCVNNLKQIGIAIHGYEDVYKKLPPAWNPDTLFSIPPQGQAAGPNVQGPIHFILLPFVEKDPLFRRSNPDDPKKGKHNSMYNGEPEGVNVPATIIPLYLCPSDHSLKECINNKGHASGNYAANLWVFDPRGPGNVYKAMPDGTSNTIMFTERYRRCSASEPAWANHPSAPGGIPNTPVFGWNEFAESVGPVKGKRVWGSPNFSNGTLGFQVQPAIADCDPSITQSAHSRGIQVLMGDVSVRTVSTGVSVENWLHACIPNDGLPANLDWLE